MISLSLYLSIPGLKEIEHYKQKVLFSVFSLDVYKYTLLMVTGS